MKTYNVLNIFLILFGIIFPSTGFSGFKNHQCYYFKTSPGTDPQKPSLYVNETSDPYRLEFKPQPNTSFCVEMVDLYYFRLRSTRSGRYFQPCKIFTWNRNSGVRTFSHVYPGLKDKASNENALFTSQITEDRLFLSQKFYGLLINVDDRLSFSQYSFAYLNPKENERILFEEDNVGFIPEQFDSFDFLPPDIYRAILFPLLSHQDRKQLRASKRFFLDWMNPLKKTASSVTVSNITTAMPSGETVGAGVTLISFEGKTVNFEIYLREPDMTECLNILHQPADSLEERDQQAKTFIRFITQAKFKMTSQSDQTPTTSLSRAIAEIELALKFKATSDLNRVFKVTN
jgi:hypothetical protein